ncbi:site-2 protease family protein [Fervidobacterium thailandense]|uniref:Peptidase M50 n=1 Tax=Fervidobacterium thailandense TaxID=1008305 RepID=A0A1E3G3V4_9BACT|nr:site-2 protease family protein [Fervidobacterium thailandense]ODN30842.1 peptidase M50 [Fervidobacterium thailandense]
MFSFLMGITLGFVSYLLVSWPREILRTVLTKATIRNNFSFQLNIFNPFRYVDPVGFLCFVLFDFGWTRAPFIDYPKSKRRDLIVYSLYGIAASFILFFLYGLLARLSIDSRFFEVFYDSAKWSLTYAFVSLFPLPPLDGSRALLGLLPSRYYEWYLKFNFYGVLFMIGLLLLWIFPMIMRPFVSVISNVTKFIVFGNW